VSSSVGVLGACDLKYVADQSRNDCGSAVWPWSSTSMWTWKSMACRAATSILIPKFYSGDRTGRPAGPEPLRAGRRDVVTVSGRSVPDLRGEPTRADPVALLVGDDD